MLIVLQVPIPNRLPCVPSIYSFASRIVGLFGRSAGTAVPGPTG